MPARGCPAGTPPLSVAAQTTLRASLAPALPSKQVPRRQSLLPGVSLVASLQSSAVAGTAACVSKQQQQPRGSRVAAACRPALDADAAAAPAAVAAEDAAAASGRAHNKLDGSIPGGAAVIASASSYQRPSSTSVPPAASPMESPEGPGSVQGRIKYCLRPTPLVGALNRPQQTARGCAAASIGCSSEGAGGGVGEGAEGGSSSTAPSGQSGDFLSDGTPVSLCLWAVNISGAHNGDTAAGQQRRQRAEVCL
eukprot:XP_001692563.1 predicted protein [Chlamydomonas reinhardtii]